MANIEEAKRLFDNFTFDLIFARPGQTISDWKRELEVAYKICNLLLSGSTVLMYKFCSIL